MKNVQGLPLLLGIFVVLQIILSAILIFNTNKIIDLLIRERASTTDYGVESLTIQSDIPEFVGEIEPSPHDPFRGAEEPIVTIVEFSDYQCPYCASASIELEKIINEYDGLVRHVFKDYPLQQQHHEAFSAAIFAQCAGEQNMFWEMHNLLFLNQQDLSRDAMFNYATDLDLDLAMLDSCIEDDTKSLAIQEDISIGTLNGVVGTPTFFINGYRISGFRPDVIRQQIDFIIEESN